MDVLVAFATRAGSTEGVARRIGEVLQGAGHRVDVRNVTEVSSAAGYEAVVVGSAVRMRRWLREAMGFLVANESYLREVPVAIFTVGLTGVHRSALAQAEAEHTCRFPLFHFRELDPVSHACFTGALDYSKLSLSEDAVARAFGVGEGDYRDWDEIERWASHLVLALRSPEPALP